MTDFEKTLEIQNEYQQYAIKLGKNEEIAETYGIIARKAANDMADYKNRQFIDFLHWVVFQTDNNIRKQIKNLEEELIKLQ